MSQKIRIRLSLLASIFTWSLFLFFDIYTLFVEKYHLNVNISGLLPQVFLTLFILSLFFYFRLLISKAESVNFIDLLWRVFLTGLLMTVGSLAIRLFASVFANSSIINSGITINILYDILSAFVLVFLMSTFVVWKRLILYQKSKSLIKLWNFYQYFLLGGLVFDFFGHELMSINFNIAMVFLSGLALILSFNLKWVAYLNFKQKWKSILFILLSTVYVYHFLLTLDGFSNSGLLTINLLDRVSIISLFGFIIFYAGVSVLVTLFNLPTSSVFEKKIQEAMDFQKLSLAPKGSTSIKEVAELLMASSMSAVFADAAWVEIRTESKIMVTNGITEKDVIRLQQEITDDSILKTLNFREEHAHMKTKVGGAISDHQFKSVIALPIWVKDRQLGVLTLLQEVAEAFNREMVEIIVTFVNQAGISIENTLLISDAIENERYKEQLNIAKNVQKSLLPGSLSHNECFDITAFSVAADEVGGDYYDILETAPGMFSLIIADVSGKGTSAAFNMAQMKGIFHSLANQKFSVTDFLIQANRALSKCLERSSFITASYFKIDTKHKEIKFGRAGHCPGLFFSSSANKVCLLEGNGLGLGILRNSEFNQYVEEGTTSYKPRDILLLHTDGISEAKNAEGIQFGMEGIKRSLLNNLDKTAGEIRKALIEDLEDFLGGLKLDDDYTLAIVKFLA